LIIFSIGKWKFVTYGEANALIPKKLIGQHFRSSSDSFNRKSTEALLLLSPLLSGGASSSTIHILFLANPCCSNVPQFAN
jgi:hypothetical protein